MPRPRALALIAAAAIAALAAAPAQAWTPAQPIGTPPAEFYDLTLGFNARGDALLVGSGGYLTTTALRAPARAFGPLRTSRHDATFVRFGAGPVLGMDRRALLLGEWDDQIAEIAPASHGDCCERAAAARLGRGGRLGAPIGLSPRGHDAFVSTVWTDERGAAGITMQESENWSFAIRTRAGALTQPRAIATPPGGTLLAAAVRATGHGHALWTVAGGGLHHGLIRPDGSIASGAMVAPEPPGERFAHASVLRSRTGHVWLLHRATTRDLSDPDPVDRVRVAPLDRDGRAGAARALPSARGPVPLALDDDGALHALWDDGSALRTASALPGRGFGRTRTVARGGRFGDIALAAGPRGRTAFAWVAEPSRSTDELWVANGHRTRVGRPVRMARLAKFESVADVALGISRRGEALVAWHESGDVDEPARFRYSAHRLR